MIQQMPFLGLVVDDLNVSTRFYQEKLGLGVNAKESIPHVYTQFDLNGGGAIFSLLTAFEVEGVTQNFDAVLYVDDVDAAYAQWQTGGVEMVCPPNDQPFGRTFLFRTPDGHVLRVLNGNTPAATVTTFVKAMNSGDVELALSLYDVEASFVVEPGTVVFGRDEIKEVLASMISLKPTLKTISSHVFEQGEIALYHSEWEMLFVDEAGQEVRDHGFSADVLKRQANGQWRILIDNPWGTAVLQSNN